MKKATTILKLINELGQELHNNYTDAEIEKAILKVEKSGYCFNSYLIDTINEGLITEDDENI